MEEAGTLRADVAELRRTVEDEREAATRAASEARQEADAVKQLRYDVSALMKSRRPDTRLRRLFSQCLPPSLSPFPCYNLTRPDLNAVFCFVLVACREEIRVLRAAADRPRASTAAGRGGGASASGGTHRRGTHRSGGISYT